MRRLRDRGLPRRLGASLAVIIAAAAIVGVVLAVGSPSSTKGASSGAQASGAATVQRRNLVETDTEAGTLSYAGTQTVYNRLSGTITWLPSVGQVIHPGQTLYKVDGQPVTLMNGTTPAYRDLSPADSAGPDILELNRSLVALGFNPSGIVQDDVWQPATTAAVEDFQQSVGQAPTAVLTLGQVVFLPGNQVVSALEATLGSGGGGAGAGSGSAASDTSPTHSAEFVSLDTTKPGQTGQTGPTGPTGPSRGRRPNTLTALLALLRAETLQLKAESAELRAAQRAAASGGHSNPGASTSHGGSGTGGKSGGGGGGGSSGGSGSSGGPGHSGGSGGGSAGSGGGTGGSGGGGNATPILQTSSTKLVATVDLDASKQSEAQVGERVTVELPSGSTVDGTITAVSSVAQSSSGSGNGNGSGGNGGSGSGSGNGNGNGSSSATIPITISLSGHLGGAGLDQAAVSVNFAQARANNVLSVPVTALLATSGGGYAVQEAAAPHRLIPVSTGLFAAGYVQISGPGIYPGLGVTDSQG